MSKKITIIGSTNTDMVVKLPRLPKPGETIIGGDFFISAGGKGANQAVAAARAGGKINFISCLGDDMFAENALNNFHQEGISINNILKKNSVQSGVALIFVGSDGENSIAVAPGANYHLLPKDLEQLKHTILDSDILLMQLEIPVETVKFVAEIAHQNNVKVILNPAPAQKLDEKILKCISIITPNETETEILTGIKIRDERSIKKAAGSLLKQGIETVIITLGEKGAFAATKDFSELISTYKTEAVDTTAAGDVFSGALAVAIAEGLSLTSSVKFANAAASISVKKLGAQTSAPYREEINKLFNDSIN